MENKVVSLFDKIMRDIKQNPDKINKYAEILAKHGYLKNVKVIKVKRASSELLKAVEGSKTVIILK